MYLGATNLYTLQLVELQRSLAEVQHIIASVKESVKTPKQKTVLELPGVVGCLLKGLCFVVKVVTLESSEDPHSQAQLVNSLLWLHLHQLWACKVNALLQRGKATERKGERTERLRTVLKLFELHVRAAFGRC